MEVDNTKNSMEGNDECKMDTTSVVKHNLPVIPSTIAVNSRKAVSKLDAKVLITPHVGEKNFF